MSGNFLKTQIYTPNISKHDAGASSEPLARPRTWPLDWPEAFQLAFAWLLAEELGIVERSWAAGDSDSSVDWQQNTQMFDNLK